jgi:DNA-directed RNA polymerase specialized sigma24 family protein
MSLDTDQPTYRDPSTITVPEFTAAWAGLIPTQQQTLRRLTQGVSYESLAAEIGVALGTIKSRAYRGYHKLADTLNLSPKTHRDLMRVWIIQHNTHDA